MRELFVERVIPHGEEDGKAGGVEVVPVSDAGVVEPVQCMETPEPRKAMVEEEASESLDKTREVWFPR